MIPENLEETVSKEGFGYAGKSGNVLYLAEKATLVDAAWLLPEEPKYFESFEKKVKDGNPIYMFISVDTKTGEVCAEGVGNSVNDFKSGKYYSRIKEGERSDNIMKGWIYQNEKRVIRALSNPEFRLTLGKKFDGEIYT